ESVTDHAAQQCERLFALHPFAIRTIATCRIVEIDDRDDARHEWNRLSLQAFGITAAVPFFVVITDDVFDRVRKVDALEDVAANYGMDLHLREFSFSEFARFVEDVLRHRELA